MSRMIGAMPMLRGWEDDDASAMGYCGARCIEPCVVDRHRCVALFIARQQAETARQKLLDLFDRRYTVYQLLLRMIEQA
jgi:hypothetical protein